MTRTAAANRTAASQKDKILRVCLVQTGTIIDERRFYKQAALSIGRSPSNTFSVLDDTLPTSHQLFSIKSGVYELVFTEGMRGRLSLEGVANSVDLANLKAQGLAGKKGRYYHFPLSERHRGKIVIGDLTIIFQFVVPPPIPAKSTLPLAVKGSFLRQIDWFFTTCLLATATFVLSFVVAFHLHEPVKELPFDLNQLDERWAKVIVPTFKPKEAKKLNRKPPPKQKVKKTRATTKKKGNPIKPKVEEEAARAKAVKSKKIRKKIAGKGMLAVLGTLSDGPGAVADVFSAGGSFGRDLDDAFEGISGVRLAQGRAVRSQRGGRSGELASIADLKTQSSDTRGKLTTDKLERAVGMVQSSGVQEIDGDLDPSKIARTIKRRAKGVQRCYEKELKRIPNLAGKIEIEITIAEDGRVEFVEVIHNSTGSEAIGACAMKRIKRWRFPKPDGGSVTFIAPFTFISG